MSSGLVNKFYENTFYFIQTIFDSDDNQTRVLWLNPLLHYYPYSLNESEFYSGRKRRNTTYLERPSNRKKLKIASKEKRLLDEEEFRMVKRAKVDVDFSETVFKDFTFIFTKVSYTNLGQTTSY